MTTERSRRRPAARVRPFSRREAEIRGTTLGAFDKALPERGSACPTRARDNVPRLYSEALHSVDLPEPTMNMTDTKPIPTEESQ